MSQYAAPFTQMKKLKAPLIRFTAGIIIIFGSTITVFNYWSNEILETSVKLQQESLRNMVSLSRNSISHIIQLVHEKKISRTEGIQRVRNIVRTMVYRDRYGMNYIFMSAYDGTMLVQPFQPALEMTDQWDLRDINGTYIIRQLIQTAKKNPAGGFVKYYYYPPGSSAPQEKLAFVIGIPELECYIGTGMYMQHVYHEQNNFIRKARLWAIGFIVLMLFPVLIFLKYLINQNKKLEEEIQEREHAESLLKDNAIFLNTLLEAIPNPVFYKNSRGIYTGCNTAFERAFGISRHELIGKKPQDIAPADRARQYSDMDTALFNNPGTQTYESVMRYADGTLHNVIFSKATFTGSRNEVAGIVGIIIDITTRKKAEDELRKSEERFRNISEIANDYIYYADVSTDNSFTVAWRYGNYKKLYGYSELDIEEAGGLMHLIPAEDYQCIENTYPDLLNNKKIVNEYRVKNPEGAVKWLKDIRKPVWDEERHRVTGFFSVVQDITEQKEAHEKIIRSLHEKETLLKEIHHRVKNNLQVITSLLSLQSRKINNPEIVRKFEDSQNRIRAMAMIHEKLYRSENLSYIDFSGYLKSLSQELYVTLGGNTQEITMRYSLETVNLSVDLAIPCGLIVNELISNAIKHAFIGITHEKIISVTLETCPEEKIRITVKDNGRGLPEDTSLGSTASLGLVLIPMLAQQINGDITVLENEGTGFILSFPDFRKQVQ